MHSKVVFALLMLVLSAAASPAASLPGSKVKYGSGTAFVERIDRRFGSCTDLNPGSVCTGLATACAASLMSSEASIIWKALSCALAGLWCGAQAILNLLCCLNKLPKENCSNGQSFHGNRHVDVNERVIDNIASFSGKGGNTFDRLDLLHASQGAGGGSILGHAELEAVIDGIMVQLTGSRDGMANLNQVNNLLKKTGFEVGFGH